jgi:hypothetical protein
VKSLIQISDAYVTIGLMRVSNNFNFNFILEKSKSRIFDFRLKVGRLPIISFITSLTFKYYSRLKELPSTRLVKETFEVDKGLFNSGQKSWYSFISNSAKKMNVRRESYRLQYNIKCSSSSTLLQLEHNLKFLEIFGLWYLPFSISNVWTLILKLVRCFTIDFGKLL